MIKLYLQIIMLLIGLIRCPYGQIDTSDRSVEYEIEYVSNYGLTESDMKEYLPMINEEMGIVESDTDKVIADKIFSFMLEHIRYAHDNSLEGKLKTLAEGGIIEGDCSNYCHIYYLLCCYNDIPCYMRFDSVAKGYHAWNYVCLDGEWNWIDVCWSYTHDNTESWNLSPVLWSDHYGFESDGNECWVLMNGHGDSERFDENIEIQRSYEHLPTDITLHIRDDGYDQTNTELRSYIHKGWIE